MPSPSLLRAFASAIFIGAPLAASPITFEKQVLDERFFAEGVAVADVNRDGHPDVLAGPFWFAGPDFKKRTELRAPHAYNIESYSDAFILDSGDFDGDGWTDLLQIGWPGRAALWFRNPGAAGGDWERHVAFPIVGTESPTFTDLDGDGQRELVFAANKKLGWAAPNPARPTEPWDPFRTLTPEGPWQRYSHGLGVGDVNGDGRADVLTPTGWWEQPASLAGDPVWPFHTANFGEGGAQMFTYDVNADGRADVITSIHGHRYGLSWYEQLPPSADGSVAWREHRILSRDANEKLNGVQFSQPHAVVLADLDGDGLKDIVTGKRAWAHGTKGDPEPNAAAVLYWFRLTREGSTVRYEPHLIDDASGVGTQFTVTDVNGDKQLDIVVANKRGVFVFRQKPAP
jgi:hypothetical protein